jgi:hypothetical protein
MKKFARQSWWCFHLKNFANGNTALDVSKMSQGKKTSL